MKGTPNASFPIPTFSLREIVEAVHEQFRDIANAFSRALCRLSMIFPHCGWGIGLISVIRFVQGRIKNKSNKVAKVSRLNQIHRTVI